MKSIRITATCVIQVEDPDVASTKQELIADEGYEAFNTLESAAQQGIDEIQIHVEELSASGEPIEGTRLSAPDKSER